MFLVRFWVRAVRDVSTLRTHEAELLMELKRRFRIPVYLVLKQSWGWWRVLVCLLH